MFIEDCERFQFPKPLNLEMTVDAIIDRFGEDVITYANDMESFRVVVNVAVSHVFYSWVFGFNGKVKIKGPEAVKEKYDEMIRIAYDDLGKS